MQSNTDSREEGHTVLLEVSLVGIEHAVEPREELLGTVVGVEDDGAVEGGVLAPAFLHYTWLFQMLLLPAVFFRGQQVQREDEQTYTP